MGKKLSLILADRHQNVLEGIRGLIETVFDHVVMVADEESLLVKGRQKGIWSSSIGRTSCLLFSSSCGRAFMAGGSVSFRKL